MFAVVKTGGKQYRVVEEQELRVEKLDGEAGSIVQLSEVLMVGDTLGTPLVSGASVAAEIVEQGRARKVIAFKKRRRQNSRRKIGHRQAFTLIRVSEILTDGRKPSKEATGAPARGQSAPALAVESAAGAAEIVADEAAKVAATAAGVTAGVATGAAGAVADAAESAVETVSDATSGVVETITEAAEDAATLATGSTATKEQEGPLFEAPEGEGDKLTKIKGIGPVAERQLNEQGITTFRQIADLSDDDIQRVDDYMPFSSAQIRDWQGQAREFIK